MKDYSTALQRRPPQIPRDTSPDSTLALLSEGYTFISERCRRYRTDLFETRLMLRKAICVTGPDAAEMFYQPDRFTRRNALPPTALMLLQDKGSVQTLDGEEHRRRKQMFMSLMTPEAVQRLAATVSDEWRSCIEKWEAAEEIVLHDEVRAILNRAVCRWAGVPLTQSEAEQRTHEFGAMIDGAGAVGPWNWRGLWLRTRTERWSRDLIDKIRGRTLDIPQDRAAHTIAWYRGLDGELLDRNAAAVELINVLRPTVAVARFITFAALALHEYPQCRRRLQDSDERYLEFFVQEVRRFYPFFPAIGGRVREEFEWRGHRFAEGTWVLLDLYGTNHDTRVWEEPDAFRPERFRQWDKSDYNFIPQGGGDYYVNHRCAGEGITVELMKTAVRLLTTVVRYSVPRQDLTVDLSRMPALPRSGFSINQISRA